MGNMRSQISSLMCRFSTTSQENSLLAVHVKSSSSNFVLIFYSYQLIFVFQNNQLIVQAWLFVKNMYLNGDYTYKIINAPLYMHVNIIYFSPLFLVHKYKHWNNKIFHLHRFNESLVFLFWFCNFCYKHNTCSNPIMWRSCVFNKNRQKNGYNNVIISFTHEPLSNHCKMLRLSILRKTLGNEMYLNLSY